MEELENDIEPAVSGEKGGADGFRVVLVPEDGKVEARLFAAEGVHSERAEELFRTESGRDGATVYEVPGYRSLVNLLNHTDEFKGVRDVRICANGRGYVRYERKGNGNFPPEKAIREVLSLPPKVPEWLPKAGTRVSICQDAEHPEGVVTVSTADDAVPVKQDVVKQHARAAATSRFILDTFALAYLKCGGTLPGLARLLEKCLED